MDKELQPAAQHRDDAYTIKRDLNPPHQGCVICLVRYGDNKSQVYLTPSRSLSIGRSMLCDIVLLDKQVSHRHSRLYWKGSKVFVEDLQSKNYTYLNGERIYQPVPVSYGDVIQIALCATVILVDPRTC